MAAPILTILHYVFLTREQRYTINVSEAEVEVVGCCSPAWIHNGEHLTKTVEEIFAKYLIKHCPEPEKQTLNFMDEGFFVRLSPNMTPFLLDYKDNGSMYLSLTHKNIITVQDKIVPVIHFLIVEDMEMLKNTLC